MKRDYLTIVGISLIMLVLASPARSSEDGRPPYPIGYYWMNPDGSRGTALPPLSLATGGTWVNPDGVRGILSEVKASRSLHSGDWVNPDGVHGTFNQPTLGLTYSLKTSK